MFSTKLTRAAHRATAIPTPTSTACACLTTRSTHQRRHSSSKTSCPPDSTSKPAPAAKASEEAQTAVPAQKSTKGKAKSAYGRKVNAAEGGKKAASEPVDQFAGLPSVPSVQNLSAHDLRISSFYGLHRPMSLTTTVPPPASQETFNAVFESRPQQDPWEGGNSAQRRPEDVIYTLHNTIETLENGANSSQDEGVRWEVIHESPSNNNNNSTDSVKHLDGAPRLKSLEELVAQFKPFNAPPPPQPFPEQQQKPTSSSAADKKASAKSLRQPKQKTYTATITLTESEDSHGQKTYSASSSPIVRLPEPTTSTSTSATSSRQAKQPFLTRMHERSRAYHSAERLGRATDSSSKGNAIRRAPSPLRVERMVAISVKRQRKLKMKKHKYKKLMKRTRNLRRRLDRT